MSGFLPAQQLVGFMRVDLEPGASKAVTFKLPMSLLASTGLSGESPARWAERGRELDRHPLARHVHDHRLMRVVTGEDRAFFSVASVA